MTKVMPGQAVFGGLVLLALAAGVFSSSSIASAAGELPVYDDFDLTADGRRLLYLQSNGDTYQAMVRHLPDGEPRSVLPEDPKGGLLNWCRWANADRLLCSLRYYRSIGRAGKVLFTRLVAVNHDGSDHRVLVPRAKNFDRRPPVFNAQVQDQVLSWLSDSPDEVLIALKRDDPNRPSVFRLNIYTNKLARERRPRGKIHRWYADHAGQVRLALGYKNESEPLIYRVDGQRLRQFPRAPFSSEVPPAPLAFDDERGVVYMNMTNATDRHGIYEVRIDDGSVQRAVFTDPEFDVFGRLIVDDDGPAGVQYVRHHPTLVWFDKALNGYFLRLKRELPGTELNLITSDSDFQRFVVMSYGGVVPRYYLIDAQADERQFLGRGFESLRDETIADLKPVTYTARDGTQIPAYLALPKAAQGEPVPMVLFPHSGPYARDSAEFDYWTQFFIDRGYGVLKPNYRGSVGYGQIFMRAGYRQWGLRMQEDLIDGLAWLTEQGIAESNRSCVVGASYGGYTALVSAYKFADRIQCAVSMAGISDLEELVARLYEFELVRRNRERIQSGDQLRANSPVHQASNMGVPLLVVHGDTDTVVRVKQARRLAQALQRHDKDFVYLEQEGGDHFLSRQRHRSEFFEAMEAFLATHLNSG